MLDGSYCAALRGRWAELIRRVYESPPVRPRCGSEMCVVGFITHPALREGQAAQRALAAEERQVHDIGEEAGALFIVRELLEGESWRSGFVVARCRSSRCSWPPSDEVRRLPPGP